MHLLAVLAASALGGVFLASAVTKLASPGVWRAQASDLGVPAMIVVVLPTLEACLGAALLVQWHRRLAAVGALALLVAFTTLLIVRIAEGRRPPCACFGTFSARPIGWRHVGRNTVFVGLALVAVAVR